MEKKLNRQIGYKPPKSNGTTTVLKSVKTKPVVATKVVNGAPSTAKDIIAWIKAHPLFKWGTMCEAVGMDKGNFKRTMECENPSIRPENILKIEAVLKDYGYGVKK